MFNLKKWLKQQKCYFKKPMFFRKPIALSRILLKNPHKKGLVRKVMVITPRKPNSARRKSAKTEYKIKRYAKTYVPGGENNLKRFSNVLLRGKGARDLPGVYTISIRGVYDLFGILNKTKRRSVYGTKKFKC